MFEQNMIIMNRLSQILGILNLVILVLFISYYFTTNEKLVYVDSNQLLNNYKGMISARKEYQQKATTWKANIDTLTNEIKAQIAGYEKGASKMTAKEKSLSEELIRTKQKQLGEYQQAMNARAQQEDQEMTTRVLTEVNAFLKSYGERKGYQIILAATEYGNIAYAEDRFNITDEVLEGLNNSYTGN